MGLMMKELVHDQIQLRNTEVHKRVDGRTKCIYFIGHLV